MLLLQKKDFKVFIILLILIFIYVYIFTQNSFNRNNSKELRQFQKRNAHLQIACYNHKDNKIDVPQFKRVLRILFIDTVHNISWCPVIKCGSSVWLKGFAHLGGALTNRILKHLNSEIITWNMVARNAFPKKQNQSEIFSNFNKTKSFLIVRHPFDRILAMYRDSFYIQQPNFKKFLITLVANYSSFSNDWLPIYRQCLPCIFQYNYIIKTEYFVADNRRMIKELGMNLNLEFKEKSPDWNTRLYYFSSIPCDLLKQLFELYKEDFMYFNYCPERFYSMNKCK